MNEVKILKPADGLKVRRPDTLAHLPVDGEAVEMNTYWHRRLAEGDVIEIKPQGKSTGGDK